MALFAGLQRSFGQYIVPQGAKADARGKVEGRAETWSKRSLLLEDWEAHLSGERGLGIVPIRDDDTCLFGALDIDVYPIDHREIYEICKERDIPLILCRSKSGGIHGYVFFSEPVPAKLLRERLRSWSACIGHIGCEVFPKQDRIDDRSLGSWINMPYAGGDLSLRYAFGDDGALTPEAFLDLAESKRVTLDWLEAWSAPEPEAPSEKSDWYEGPPCLQYLGDNKKFIGGSRNMGFFNVCKYLKDRIGNGWKEVARAYNARHFDPPLRGDEIRQTIASVGRRDYSYTCNRPPISECCDRRTCLKRKFGVKPGGDERGADESNVDLGQLQKILSEPPQWRILANGKYVELDTEELATQSRFWLKVLAQTNVQGEMLKPEAWKRLLKLRLDEVEEILVPDQLKLHNQVQHYLEEFCSTKAKAKAIDELLNGRPWTDAGRTYFMPSDFREFLHTRKVGFTQQKLTAVMYDLGCEEHIGRLKGRTSTFWSVPEPTSQTEPFDVPKLPKEEPF